MRIRRLVLESFGQFRGRTELDLLPRKRYGKRHPVVLIGGTNGAGKTTILDAIRLCLYGSLALGDRVSQEQYRTYLRSCVHRVDGAAVSIKSASVGLEFDYGVAGEVHRFEVERSWDCTPGGVLTDLRVQRDGAPLDELEQEHAEDFLRDLIPQGVSQLFFFDGEKIQEMARTQSDDVSLLDSVRSLLGLDLLGRLHDDLTIYTARIGTSNASKALRDNLAKVERELRDLNRALAEQRSEYDLSLSGVDRVHQEIARAKDKLSRRGGTYAERRGELEQEESELSGAIARTESAIRDRAAELLPFTLCIPLCRELDAQLDAEQEVQAWTVFRELAESRAAGLFDHATDALFPNDDPPVDEHVRQQLVDRVKNLLEQVTEIPDEVPEVPTLHALSKTDSERLRYALHRVVNELPSEMQELEVELERLTRRLQEVRQDLRKVPEEDAIQPIVERVNELNRQLGEAEAEHRRREEAVQAAAWKVKEKTRERDRIERKIGEAEELDERRRRAQKVQAVVDEYSMELTSSKLADLSQAVGECFSRLWRKGDRLHRIEIDPTTCDVSLLDAHDRVVPKERLSAGERQIYAISVLWALARVSGRPLPMVIDTPLARLDAKHRRHLVTRYFPEVSHQTIILSTDTEIDEQYFGELSKSISHAYHLSFDEREGCTLVEEGYFWREREEAVAR